MFYDISKRTNGLVSNYDYVALDEIQSIKFTDPLEMQGALKGYLESGEYHVGSYRGIGSAGFILLGNIDTASMDTDADMFAHLPSVEGSADIIARRSDLDFNDHVNNVHYVEWMLEAADASPSEIDIVFRQAAKAGDRLVSERCAADGGRTLHAIRRPSDNAILATAATGNGLRTRSFPEAMQ